MINCSFALKETYKYNSIVQQEIDSTPKLHFPMKKKTSLHLCEYSARIYVP